MRDAKEVVLKRTDERKWRSLENLDRLAHLLDDRFRIPGTRWRFGLDGIIGLVPGAGDIATAMISAYIVWSARRLGTSRSANIKMAGNLLVDFMVGSIPLLGDIFDIGFKANRKNLRILQEDLGKKRNSGS